MNRWKLAGLALVALLVDAADYATTIHLGWERDHGLYWHVLIVLLLVEVLDRWREARR